MRDVDDLGMEVLEEREADRLLEAIAGREVVFTGLDLEGTKTLISELVERVGTVSAAERQRQALESGIEDGVVVSLEQRGEAGSPSSCRITGLEVTDTAGTAVVYKFPERSSVKTEMEAPDEAVAENVVSRERLNFGLDMIGRLDWEKLDTEGRRVVMNAIVQVIYNYKGER